MRKLIAAVVVLGLMAVPAMADLTPSTFTPTLATGLSPTFEGTVGVYPGGPYYGVNYGHLLSGITPSDMLTVTFAFHWPYGTPVWGVQAQAGFAYDNSELAVVSMNSPATGPWAGGANNFPSATFWSGANPTSGMQQVGSLGAPLWCNPPFVQSTMTTEGYIHMANSQALVVGSGVYPFAQIQFHVKDVISDVNVDAYYASFALLFWLTPSATGSTYWTAGGIAERHTGIYGYSTHTTGSVYVPHITSITHWGGSFGFGVGIPEPASLSLLGLGLASVSAGVWRRRRR